MERGSVKLSNLRRDILSGFVIHLVLTLYLSSDFCSVRSALQGDLSTTSVERG